MKVLSFVYGPDQQFSALKDYAPRFFSAQPYRAKEADRDAVLSFAYVRLWRRPYNFYATGARGDYAKMESYFFDILKYSWKDCFAIKRHREIVAKELGQAQDVIDKPELALGDLLELYSSPPYKVVFSERNNLGDYLNDPSFVPRFSVVPACPKKIAGSHSSTVHIRKKYFGSDEISISVAEELRDNRSTFGQAVRKMLPQYVRHCSYQGLSLKHKQLMRDCSRSCNTKQAMTCLKLASSTFYDRLGALESLGWKLLSPKSRRMRFEFNPLLDPKNLWFRRTALKKIAELSDAELFEALLDWREHSGLDDGAQSDEEAFQHITEATEKLVCSLDDQSALITHDKHLRKMIVEIVERPAFCRNVSLEQLDELLARLNFHQKRDLLFRAIRTKKSVVDVLSLTDHFGTVATERGLDLSLLTRSA